MALRANIKALVAEAERLSTEVDAPAVRPPAAEAARLGAEVDAPVSPQSVAEAFAQDFCLVQLASETELLFDKREPFTFCRTLYNFYDPVCEHIDHSGAPWVTER